MQSVGHANASDAPLLQPGARCLIQVAQDSDQVHYWWGEVVSAEEPQHGTLKLVAKVVGGPFKRDLNQPIYSDEKKDTVFSQIYKVFPDTETVRDFVSTDLGRQRRILALREKLEHLREFFKETLGKMFNPEKDK